MIKSFKGEFASRMCTAALLATMVNTLTHAAELKCEKYAANEATRLIETVKIKQNGNDISVWRRSESLGILPEKEGYKRIVWHWDGIDLTNGGKFSMIATEEVSPAETLPTGRTIPRTEFPPVVLYVNWATVKLAEASVAFFYEAQLDPHWRCARTD